MSFTLHDVTVPGYRRMIDNVLGSLAKGAEHYASQGKSADELIGLRLHEDMHPMAFQLHSVVHHSAGAVEGILAGEFAPPSGLEDLDYSGFRAKLMAARSRLEAIAPEALNACAGGEVIFRFRDREMPFTVESFILSFSQPNLYFHATTAYDLLRMSGVPVGKGDYLGRLQLKA